MNFDQLKFWLILLPFSFVYLITERSFKPFLFVPIFWLILDLCVNWKTSRQSIESNTTKALTLFFSLVSISLLSGILYGQNRILLRDIFIISTSLGLFIFNKEKLNASKWLFITFSLAYVYSLSQKGINLFNANELFTYKLFLPSTATTENDFGIVYGLFSVHFLINKKWKYFFPSLFISLLVSKRALLLGLIVSGIWWYIFGNRSFFSTKFKTVFIYFFYFCLMVLSLFMTEIGEIILKIFGIENMNVGRFLMGRNELTMALRNEIDWFSFSTYFGHGPGSADTFLAFRGIGWGPISDRPFNPHNDYIKIVYDYGFFGYLLFGFILNFFYGSNLKSKALLLYTLTVFCFDNSLIFMIYHIVAGFICAENIEMEKYEYPSK